MGQATPPVHSGLVSVQLGLVSVHLGLVWARRPHGAPARDRRPEAAPAAAPQRARPRRPHVGRERGAASSSLIDNATKLSYKATKLSTKLQSYKPTNSPGRERGACGVPRAARARRARGWPHLQHHQRRAGPPARRAGLRYTQAKYQQSDELAQT